MRAMRILAKKIVKIIFFRTLEISQMLITVQDFFLIFLLLFSYSCPHSPPPAPTPLLKWPNLHKKQGVLWHFKLPYFHPVLTNSTVIMNINRLAMPKSHENQHLAGGKTCLKSPKSPVPLFDLSGSELPEHLHFQGSS